MRKASSTTNIVDDLTSIFGGASSSGEFRDVEGKPRKKTKSGSPPTHTGSAANLWRLAFLYLFVFMIIFTCHLINVENLFKCID
ncbi:hypothetical protein IFM89_002577 [Coptis chinensis]|uniref:Uncharacterized protein n=1 Tax=Coptis chinensis TaxID=261450 RepID=A0A835LHF1_9MAGN|nr:hypothetical protein IFM89_002577 [Coptis chinensis]